MPIEIERGREGERLRIGRGRKGIKKKKRRNHER